VGVSAENRASAQVVAGDELEVTLELDTQPRTIVLPADLEVWLDDDALAFFDSLSYSQKKWYIAPIEQAKKPETRERRIANAVEMLRDGRKR
jgi:uncharacterized protein YdeI (YjbR/CyaY-like superfamily)